MTASKNFCILNGSLEKIETLNFAPVYAINDCVREDVRLYDTKPLCLGMHIANVLARLKEKNIEAPSGFDTPTLDRYIHRLLNVNKVYKGGVCTLLVFWQTFPERTKAQVCIFIKPLPSLGYEFNVRGAEVHFSDVDVELSPTTPGIVFAPSEEVVRTTCVFDSRGRHYASDSCDVIAVHEDVLFASQTVQPITIAFLNFLRLRQWKVKTNPFLTKETILNSSELLLCGTFLGINWASRVYKNSQEPPQIYGYTHAKRIYTLFCDFVKEV